MTNILTNSADIGNAPPAPSTSKFRNSEHIKPALKINSLMVPEDSEENYAVITDEANPVNSSNPKKKHKKFTNGYHKIEDLDLDPSLYVPF